MKFYEMMCLGAGNSWLDFKVYPDMYADLGVYFDFAIINNDVGGGIPSLSIF